MENSSSNNDQKQMEQAIVNRIAQEAIAEQRRARRWGIFFKFFFAAYLVAFLIIYLPTDIGGAKISGGKHTALVDIEGIISNDAIANADHIVSGLRAAFEDSSTAGIILRINSPGGSPVQAAYVNDEIRRLKGLYPDMPLYAVISDICASGGYYIAAAADEIYANESSIVGSIGVVMSGFGFVEAIKKLGIERRLLHAGESKGFLDPFSPLKEEDLEHIDTLLTDVHEQFISVVREGRGDRLSDDENLFTGLIWTGKQSLELGLIDGIGSAGYVARELVGEEDIVDYTRRETFLDTFAKQIGTTVAEILEKRLQLQ